MSSNWNAVTVGVKNGAIALAAYLLVTIVLYGVSEISAKFGAVLFLFFFWGNFVNQIRKSNEPLDT